MTLEEAMELLNFYRNLHYKDTQGTEERELAEAINVVLPLVARLKEHGIIQNPTTH